MAEVFKNFISMPPELMASVREGTLSASTVAKNALNSTAKIVVQLFKSATEVASEAVAQVQGKPPSTSAINVSRSAEDACFSELEGYLSAQAPMVVALYNSAAALAARYREEAQLLVCFADAVSLLGREETSARAGSGGGGGAGGALGVDNGSGAGLVVVGKGLYHWATIVYEQSSCHAEAVVECLADYVRGNKAIRDALDARTAASAAMVGAAAEVDRLKANLQRLGNGGGPSAPQQRAALEQEVGAATARANEARKFYNLAADSLLNDVERHKEAMFTDIKTVLLDFTTAQHRTEAKLLTIWEQIALSQDIPRPALMLTGGGEGY
jgi:hypothetical protein